MNVGDWVEFETIVVKARTPTGSTPTTQQLVRKRRGMVIGERHVYDVVNGNPPALSNPQTVLLVAVTMHRTYRVDPANVRLTKPPRRRPGATHRTAPAQTNAAPSAVVPLPSTLAAHISSAVTRAALRFLALAYIIK